MKKYFPLAVALGLTLALAVRFSVKIGSTRIRFEKPGLLDLAARRKE